LWIIKHIPARSAPKKICNRINTVNIFPKAQGACNNFIHVIELLISFAQVVNYILSVAVHLIIAGILSLLQ
jgi:hypothetical protein